LDAHPDNICKEGVDNINFWQRMPYASQLLRKNPLLAHAIERTLADICRYVHKLMAVYAPNEYRKIKAFVDVLPLNQSPTSYPFASFVVNVQASLEAHKDGGDDTLCVTIPFGKWTSGRLVLHEAGIVLDLSVGDVVIFPSCYITHFNLDFDGVRCSIVMFSDKHGKEWLRFRNGWNGHMVVKDTISYSLEQTNLEIEDVDMA
jgi:hypothetical protein